MGISRNSGKLPFAACFDAEQVVVDVEDLMEDYNGDSLISYKNGWSIDFEAHEQWDDILVGPKLIKNKHAVFLVDLDMGCSNERLATSKNKASLQEFLKDFDITANIEKNEKVVQLN